MRQRAQNEIGDSLRRQLSEKIFVFIADWFTSKMMLSNWLTRSTHKLAKEKSPNLRSSKAHNLLAINRLNSVNLTFFRLGNFVF